MPSARRPFTLPGIVIENSCPILRVEDLELSIRFYRDQLGFDVDWREAGNAGLSRDGGRLMVCERGQGHPGTWVWIGVDDAAALLSEFEARAVTIARALEDYPWAREFTVADPDGHMLRFGSEPLDSP